MPIYGPSRPPPPPSGAELLERERLQRDKLRIAGGAVEGLHAAMASELIRQVLVEQAALAAFHGVPRDGRV